MTRQVWCERKMSCQNRIVLSDQTSSVVAVRCCRALRRRQLSYLESWLRGLNRSRSRSEPGAARTLATRPAPERIPTAEERGARAEASAKTSSARGTDRTYCLLGGAAGSCASRRFIDRKAGESVWSLASCAAGTLASIC